MYYISEGSQNKMSFAIYVDDETSPTSVAAFVPARNELTVYGQNLSFLDEVYKTFVRGKKNTVFCATDRFVLDYFSQKRKIKIWTSCRIVYYNGGEIPQYSCPYTLESVRKQDYPTVVAHHQYGGTLEEISFCAQNFPSSALYDGDKLICWVLVHEEGSLGPLFTLPKYRGQGLAKVVVTSLYRKMLALNMFPYSYIVIGNVKSEALVEKCGSRFGNRIICWGIAR